MPYISPLSYNQITILGLSLHPHGDFTRFAVTFEPKDQIARNKTPVKDIVRIYDIIENSSQMFVTVSKKKM